MTEPALDPDSPREVLSAVTAATERLTATAAELTPERLGGESLCPGWTRGHVLAHLARNADALTGTLAGAGRGEQVPMYAGPEARESDIEEGAPRPLADQLADLRATAEEFARTVDTLPQDAWTFAVRMRSGSVLPASSLPWFRLRELEYHHVDLDAGYTPGHWPADFVAHELSTLAERFTRPGSGEAHRLRLVTTDTRREYGVPEHEGPELTVEGPAAALVAWLSGRAGADGLAAYRDGQRVADAASAVPELPPMA
nr:maleylpyruvate isomerase family mycothiol-dependent enzyme [Haloactinospora alba]